MNEVTSPDIAAIAARGLDNPASLALTEIRRLAGSALTQAPGPNAPTMEKPMAKTKISKEQFEAAKATLGNYDRGTASDGDTVAKILTAIHGDLVEIDGHRTMEEQYADSVASAQKGFTNQTPSQPHRPQVALEFTVPDLPPSDGLPLETGDAVIAREKADKNDDTVTGASARPQASTPLAAAEEFGTGAGKQLGTVANKNPAPAKPAKGEAKK